MQIFLLSELLIHQAGCRAGAFQVVLVVKNLPAKAEELGLGPWVQKVPWRTAQQSTLVFLPGESHGQRSLAGYNPKGCKESDTTELAHILFKIGCC